MKNFKQINKTLEENNKSKRLIITYFNYVLLFFLNKINYFIYFLIK